MWGGMEQCNFVLSLFIFVDVVTVITVMTIEFLLMDAEIIVIGLI